jgi:biopolymer transport protein ExbD
MKRLKTQTIEIDHNGHLYLNSIPVSLDGLRASLAPIDRITSVLIRADRDIGLQVFVDVLDLVKSLGFQKVSLQTEEKM